MESWQVKKKFFPAVIFLFLAAPGVFAQNFSMSAGAGGLLGGLFTRYNLDASGNSMTINAKQQMNQFNWGFFAFFDATYGIFSVSFQNGINEWSQPLSISGNVNPMNGKGWESMLGLSLLGKYPFSLNERFTIFPLLGLEYQISLRQYRTDEDGRRYKRNDGVDQNEMDKNGKALALEDWNSLFINLGGGLDFSLPRNFFLRGELLYGFRLMTPYEVKNLDLMKALSGDSSPKLSGLTSGPSLRLSVGCRFFER